MFYLIKNILKQTFLLIFLLENIKQKQDVIKQKQDVIKNTKNLYLSN